jgi:hypothetical protein
MPFRHALGDAVPRAELDLLVESVAGTRLRLNVAGTVSVVGGGDEEATKKRPPRDRAEGAA